MIRPNRIHFLDVIAESCHLVSDELQEFVGCGASGKISELFVQRFRPEDDDAESNLGRNAEND